MSWWQRRNVNKRGGTADHALSRLQARLFLRHRGCGEGIPVTNLILRCITARLMHRQSLVGRPLQIHTSIAMDQSNFQPGRPSVRPTRTRSAGAQSREICSPWPGLACRLLCLVIVCDDHVKRHLHRLALTTGVEASDPLVDGMQGEPDEI